MKVFYVILGAAIGAPARFAVDQFIRRFTRAPFGIFVVNIVGSFIWGFSLHTSLNAHAFFVIGLAGSFTTWSTLMMDFFLAYELKNYKIAAINLGASLFFGVLAAWAGINLTN